MFLLLTKWAMSICQMKDSIERDRDWLMGYLPSQKLQNEPFTMQSQADTYKSCQFTLFSTISSLKHQQLSVCCFL